MSAEFEWQYVSILIQTEMSQQPHGLQFAGQSCWRARSRAAAQMGAGMKGIWWCLLVGFLQGFTGHAELLGGPREGLEFRIRIRGAGKRYWAERCLEFLDKPAAPPNKPQRSD